MFIPEISDNPFGAPSANPNSHVNTGRIARLIRSARRTSRKLFLWVAALLLFAACQSIPSKPDAVFNLYRERMRNNQISEARELLSDASKSLLSEMEAKYKTDQPMENLALLNALDPEATATVMQNENTSVILQARTLKGGLRLIKLVRNDENSPWRIDLTEEINSLESFLKAREALDLIRAQAGEYAASLDAFNQQLGRIQVEEEPASPAPQPKKPVHPKPKPKPRRSVQKPR
jgi:hypothetical protein